MIIERRYCLQLLVSNYRDVGRASAEVASMIERTLAMGYRAVLLTTDRFSRDVEFRCLPFRSMRRALQKWRALDLPRDRDTLLWHLALLGQRLFSGDPVGKTQILIGDKTAQQYLDVSASGELGLGHELSANESYWANCLAIFHALDSSVVCEFVPTLRDAIVSQSERLVVVEECSDQSSRVELVCQWVPMQCTSEG